jgi:transcriptional regulator with XRE-family HTH domain
MTKHNSKSDINLEFGQVIRRIRQAKSMPVSVLTERANITKSMLSQIENNKANPSLRSLMAIAKALDVPVGEFFSDGKDEKKIVIKPSERSVVRTKNGVSIYLLLQSVKGHAMGFYYEVYEKLGASSPLHTHEGEECGLVLEGKLKVTYDKKVYNLNAGDSIVLDSRKPHKTQNIYTGTTIAIWVDIPASW